MTRVPSIRRRLVVRLLSGTLLLSFTTIALVYFYIYHEIVEQYDLALLAKARALTVLTSKTADGLPVFDLRGVVLPEYQNQERDTDYYQIWAADGRVLARSSSLGNGDLTQLPSEVWPDATFSFSNVQLPGGRTGRTVLFRSAVPSTQPVDAKASSSPEVTIAVATSGEEFDETVGHVILALSVAGIVLTGGAVAVVLWAVRRGLRPLDDLGTTAEGISAANLNFRFSAVDLPAELQPIAIRLNSLLERLDQAFQRERRFTANVAHELRTPIAELRASTEIAAKWSDDSSLTAKAVQDGLAVARRMEAIVASLLALVRSDAGKSIVNSEVLDVSEIVEDTRKSVDPAIRERCIKWKSDIPHGATVRADRRLLSSLLLNLMANAVEYSRQGEQVVVGCMTRKSVTTIVIENPCSDLMPSDLPYLLEPFWRRDQARTESGHLGLGLTIAKSYADALAATLTFDLNDGVFVASVAFAIAA